MSDPGDHGMPSPTAQAEDAWWDAVYDPSERETTHRPSTGTVDDWFASALGAMGETGETEDDGDVGDVDDGASDAVTPQPRTPVDDEDLPPIPGIPPMPAVPPAPMVPPPPPPADPRVIAPRREAPPAEPMAEPWAEREAEREVPSASEAEPESATEPDLYDLALDRDVLDRPARTDTDPAEAPSVAAEAGGPSGAEAPASPEAPAEPEASAGSAAPRTDPAPRADPRVPREPAPEAAPAAEAAAPGGTPVGPPPHVPTPTLPDWAALRWGRSRPAAGSPLPEPDALPEADPDDLDSLVPDTVLELARHGSMTLRAGSARGEEARALGVPRTDRMIVARFGDGADGLLVSAVAGGAGAGDAVRLLAASVGRSRTGLLSDLRQGAQEQLRFGLQRLTARAARGLGPDGAIHAVLAPLDPTNRLRAGFGTGPGALLLLGDDAWYDAYAGRRLTGETDGQGAGAQQPGRFRFRAVVPEPGDVLLLCTEGLATPLRAEPGVAALLAEHWSHPHPPAGVDFLRQIQARASGHRGDRTAAAIWEE